MIAFPAVAALIAMLCAGSVGWDAVKHPRPERAIWALAFAVFAIAALCEVFGAAAGWNPALARIYYLTGAVLVVGILALGELYLLRPGRMPVYTPGLSLLIVAVATTAVWNAPIDSLRLQTEGWRALERGPFLVALAATINAGGTLVLVAGALYSAWKLKTTQGSERRAAGCVLIATGTIVVALGGTLTRFGRPEYLYLAMSLGIAIIFCGVLLTRRPRAARRDLQQISETTRDSTDARRRAKLVTLPARQTGELARSGGTEGIRFIVETLLPLDDSRIGEICRRWSATEVESDAFSRAQAKQVWALRLGLPESARPRFDALRFTIQAQLAEIYAEVWSSMPEADRSERGA
jgi:hypothetical protein